MEYAEYVPTSQPLEDGDFDCDTFPTIAISCQLTIVEGSEAKVPQTAAPDEDDEESFRYRVTRRKQRASLVRRVPPELLASTPSPSPPRTGPLVRRVTMNQAAEIARKKERARTQARRISQKLRELDSEAARLRRKRRELCEFITGSSPRTVKLSRPLTGSKNKENVSSLLHIARSMK
ncbi:hypothetical protein FB45DRAFT_940231 [Roridomyces roridus]|uniref:Uncharacterized protein n=1 Tax=Roridomyces roridus TaxID=1738132 RepID=A0AAD7B7M4_9AGAR|nr:hypothetical protein FB45DRAFT_940231 [Roridomyces roridus]